MSDDRLKKIEMLSLLEEMSGNTLSNAKALGNLAATVRCLTNKIINLENRISILENSTIGDPDGI